MYALQEYKEQDPEIEVLNKSFKHASETHKIIDSTALNVFIKEPAWFC